MDFSHKSSDITREILQIRIYGLCIAFHPIIIQLSYLFVSQPAVVSLPIQWSGSDIGLTKDYNEGLFALDWLKASKWRQSSGELRA